MASTLNNIMEPFFANPSRRDIVRRLLLGNMSNQKAKLSSVLSPSVKSLLDLGCGTGEFCEVIPPEAYYGTDTDPLGIAQAKKIHPKYKFGDMQTTSDIPGQYDIVALIDTVHHLSPEIFKSTLLDSTNRLLTKDGRLLIIDAMHPKEQKSRIGSFVFAHDRGGFQRTKEQVTSELSGLFEIERYETFQEKVLTFYLLIAKRAETK